MDTSKYHLPTYGVDGVVRYFQNVTFASTVSLIPTYYSNNLSHPTISGIIVLNPAQNCQNKIGPGNALQDIKTLYNRTGKGKIMVTNGYKQISSTYLLHRQGGSILSKCNFCINSLPYTYLLQR